MEVKSSWDMWNTCPNGAALIQSKTKPTNQLRSTSKAAADRKSLWGGPGVRQEKKKTNKKSPKNNKTPKLPHPSFSPFLVTIFRAWSCMSMPQKRPGKREGRKDFHRSSPFHSMFLFIHLFLIKETVHLQLFIGVQIWSQIASCPRQEAERGGKRSGMAY